MLKHLDLVADLPPAVRLSFFPSELLGTAALPLMHSPLSAIADDIAAKRMRSHLQHTFEFDDVREAHRWIESGRAPGKLVVRV
jgi:NADPH2:quinone reductase